MFCNTSLAMRGSSFLSRWRYLLALPMLAAWLFASCLRSPQGRIAAEAGVQPVPDADTLLLDTLVSKESSATYALKLYNRHTQTIEIDKIHLLHGADRGYRINVDGKAGSEFTSVLIAPRDSIFLLLEATYPLGADDKPTLVSDSIHILCNGVSSYVTILGYRQNVTSLSGWKVTGYETLTAQRPYVVEDSIEVSSSGTLVLEAGVRIFMKPKAKMVVHGKLLSQGTPEKRVVIEGIRQDKLISSVPYRLVPGQWREVYLSAESWGNELHYTTIRNGTNGIVCAQSTPDPSRSRLLLEGCLISNMNVSALVANGGGYTLANSELSNSGHVTLQMGHGHLRVEQSTIVNLFVFERRLGCAFLYELPDGATPMPQEGVVFVQSVVDGNGGGAYAYGQHVGGQEWWIHRNAQTRVVAQDCYLRAPLETLSAGGGTYTSCVQAKALAGDVYRLDGYDPKKQNYHLYYDFRPLNKAQPPAQMPQPVQPVRQQDLLGHTRPVPSLSVGAYLPVDSLSPAPWWQPVEDFSKAD